jgi:U3 small nucleolar RNA-associated protein 12
MKTTACIRTMECGYAICSTFLPGDRHVRILPSFSWPENLNFLFQVAVGTKSGEILIYDIASSTLIETVKAHSSTVWSLHVRPDGQALVSGSADKEVKFWEFEGKDASAESVRRLHTISAYLDSYLF